MVHNGIEYADMQLIAEAYDLLRNVVGLDNDAIGGVFAEWNEGDLGSYLIEITAHIFRTRDPETGGFLVDAVLDRAGQKGTGKWTSDSALELGAPVTAITEAVFARYLSAMKAERVAASGVLGGPTSVLSGPKDQWVRAIHDALYASKVVAYAQGFDLMRIADAEYGWHLNPGEIATIWRGGCIIRAKFLNRIKEAYDREPSLQNLLLAPFFADIVNRTQTNWRKVVTAAVDTGTPTPAFCSALAYYDGYRRERLPANLIQAQRDLFGAHTYERVDRAGVFHSQWG
jgi:6-phosphogluconate dehydrogenase